MKLYISGPMTGINDYNRPAFHAAAEALRNDGHQVINPAEFILGPDATWEDYMRQDLKLLVDADAVVALPGWNNSPGARLEILVAVRLGMDILEYPSMENLLVTPPPTGAFGVMKQ